jgi:hypothetical protein
MKTFSVAAITAALVVSTNFASASDDDVSRAGYFYQQIVTLSTTGLMYPEIAFGLAADST